ncbi:MAG: flagellar basal body P-ring formation chaperone FlgA [candidate division Zixibacteria bacterium]|nr:flagellar basal body P-ring formation chaperone FlgA [candidate division Zixibacteria bacterium]
MTKIICIIGMLTAFFTFVPAMTLCAATFEEAIVEKMTSMYDLDTAWYRIEILYNPLEITETSADNISLQPLSQKEPLGVFTVIAAIEQGGETLESGQVRMKIRKYKNVLVLLDRIGRDEDLPAEKFTKKKMEITRLREQPLVSFSSLEGCRAKRNLQRGDILTSGDVALIPDLESGRNVSIVYSDGLCRVTAQGTSLQSGMAGEYIRVKNRSSRKIIIARVVDGTAVAVDP